MDLINRNLDNNSRMLLTDVREVIVPPIHGRMGNKRRLLNWIFPTADGTRTVIWSSWMYSAGRGMSV